MIIELLLVGAWHLRKTYKETKAEAEAEAEAEKSKPREVIKIAPLTPGQKAIRDARRKP